MDYSAKISEIVNSADIYDDCQGKFDLDFAVLNASSRGYPPSYNSNGKWSIYVSYELGDTRIDESNVIMRDELFADTKEEAVTLAREWYNKHYADAIRMIGNPKTADVREVVHGKWVVHPSSHGVQDRIECSVCKCCFSYWDMPRNSFCPNCGADMRGIEDGKIH
jgi:NADH pyrophosphatase NudC (nudix superfamily)